jgi:hypothetical protein
VQWGQIFDDPTIAAAILDRGIVLTSSGPSYRMRRHQERLDALRAGVEAAPAGKGEVARSTPGRQNGSERVDPDRLRPNTARSTPRTSTHRPKPSPLKAQKRAVGLLV